MTKKNLPLPFSVLTSNFTDTFCNFAKSASCPFATARMFWKGMTALLKSPLTVSAEGVVRIFEWKACPSGRSSTLLVALPLAGGARIKRGISPFPANGLSGCVAGVVIDDLHIDATVGGPLELVKNRRRRELVGRNAESVADRRPSDVVQARFEEAAREPNNFRIR